MPTPSRSRYRWLLRFLLFIGLLVLPAATCSSSDVVQRGKDFGGVVRGIVNGVFPIAATLPPPYISEPNDHSTTTGNTARVQGTVPDGREIGGQVEVRLSPTARADGTAVVETAVVETAVVNPQQGWSLAEPIHLAPGANFISADVVVSQQRSPRMVIRVWYDDGNVGKDPLIPRPLAIVSPADGAQVAGESCPSLDPRAAGTCVVVSGTGRWDGTVLLSDEQSNVKRQTTVNAGGNWQMPVPVQPGENLLSASYVGDGVSTETAQTRIVLAPSGTILFYSWPVPESRVRWINWYGNTKLAYAKRQTWYKHTQGLHSGIDFVVPAGTEIRNTGRMTGSVISVLRNHKPDPFDYAAGPNDVVVRYGDYLVVYGHTSPDNLPNVGDRIFPDQVVAYSGTDGSLEHLHLEVVKIDPNWKPPEPGHGHGATPGNIRTNPLLFFDPNSVAALKKEAKDHPGVGTVFHTLPNGKWQTPDDQPDISPDGQPLVP